MAETTNAYPSTTSPAPTVAAFYSGAGGLDLGFEQAGFDVLLANDIDPTAIDTHRRVGHARVAVAQDVATLPLQELLPAGADIVIGGPPCQGFSVAGKMDPHDPRSRHVWTFLSLVSKIKPRAFVMENVKNLYGNSRWRDLRENLLASAQMLGYSTKLTLLNAADFGVPQVRERMFLIGIRGSVEIPEIPTTSAQGERISVRQALGALPHYGEPGNDTLCTAKITPAAKPVLRKSPYAGMLFNGAGRPLNLDRPSTTLPASMGGNRTPIIEQDVLVGAADSWITRYHSHLWSGGNPHPFNVPLGGDLRRLTVEEAAVLQGFPRGTKFSGTTSAQFRQIGNSVAPPVARAVASHVRALLPLADDSTEVASFEDHDLIDIADEARARYEEAVWSASMRIVDERISETVIDLGAYKARREVGA